MAKVERVTVVRYHGVMASPLHHQDSHLTVLEALSTHSGYEFLFRVFYDEEGDFWEIRFGVEARDPSFKFLVAHHVAHDTLMAMIGLIPMVVVVLEPDCCHRGGPSRPLWVAIVDFVSLPFPRGRCPSLN